VDRDAPRHVPAQVCTALDHLRRELASVPTFAGLSPGEAREVRRGIMRSVLISLGDGPPAYDLLMNIGLAVSPELPEEEAENELLAVLDDGSFLSLVPRFIDDAKGGEEGHRDLLPARTRDRLSGKIAFRLNQSGGRRARDLLVAMFDAGLLAMENLPPDAQEMAVTARLASSFLAGKDAFLSSLAGETDVSLYRARSRPASLLVPHLIEQGRAQEAAELASAFAAHSRDGSPRAGAAREVLDLLVGSGLAKMVRGGGDPVRIMHTARVLLASGDPGQAALIEMAGDAGLPTRTASLVIWAIGEVEDADLGRLAAETILRRTADPAAEVRRAVLRTLCLLSPRGRLATFRAALDDAEGLVRREAIRGMGLSGEEEAIPLLRLMVEQAENTGTSAAWEMAAWAVDALGHGAGSVPSRHDEILRFLLELADRAVPFGIFAGLRPRRHPPLLMIALACALARTGGRRARTVLVRLSRDRDRELAAKAASLLTRSR
jgi:hypothetical protein